MDYALRVFHWSVELRRLLLQRDRESGARWRQVGLRFADGGRLRFALFFCEFTQNAIKDAINKGAGVLAAVAFGDFDSFVDGYRGQVSRRAPFRRWPNGGILRSMADIRRSAQLVAFWERS